MAAGLIGKKGTIKMINWKNVLELNNKRERTGGSESDLCNAIRGGADLRIETTFRHNEHIDTQSNNNEFIREVSEFRSTYVLDNRWVAGFMTLRQPVEIPKGFTSRPSLSLFMYNQNGEQAIARPYLDGGPAIPGKLGATALEELADMPKYHQLDSWDSGTNAPSSNFIYDFGLYKYWINDEWREVLSHNADGTIIEGSMESLIEAFNSGCEVKVGVRGICADLASDPHKVTDHEVFIQIGFTYHYTERNLFMGETHPFVRVEPSIPLRYKSGNWDYAWLMPRTDGYVAILVCDPYSLQYQRKEGYYPIRWFVR
jgi:hypothetical protein